MPMLFPDDMPEEVRAEMARMAEEVAKAMRASLRPAGGAPPNPPLDKLTAQAGAPSPLSPASPSSPTNTSPAAAPFDATTTDLNGHTFAERQQLLIMAAQKMISIIRHLDALDHEMLDAYRLAPVDSFAEGVTEFAAHQLHALREMLIHLLGQIVARGKREAQLLGVAPPPGASDPLAALVETIRRYAQEMAQEAAQDRASAPPTIEIRRGAILPPSPAAPLIPPLWPQGAMPPQTSQAAAPPTTAGYIVFADEATRQHYTTVELGDLKHVLLQYVMANGSSQWFNGFDATPPQFYLWASSLTGVDFPKGSQAFADLGARTTLLTDLWRASHLVAQVRPGGPGVHREPPVTPPAAPADTPADDAPPEPPDTSWLRRE